MVRRKVLIPLWRADADRAETLIGPPLGGMAPRRWGVERAAAFKAHGIPYRIAGRQVIE